MMYGYPQYQQAPLQKVAAHQLFDNMNCILEPSEGRGALYLGDLMSTMRSDLLHQHGIGAILSVAVESSNSLITKSTTSVTIQGPSTLSGNTCWLTTSTLTTSPSTSKSASNGSNTTSTRASMSSFIAEQVSADQPPSSWRT